MDDGIVTYSVYSQRDNERREGGYLTREVAMWAANAWELKTKQPHFVWRDGVELPPATDITMGRRSMADRSQIEWHNARVRRGEKVGGGYFVFRRGRTTGRIKINPNKPPYEHASLDDATKEATRLAMENHGIDFVVFQQVGRIIYSAGESEV